jgi:hypothetical protein
MIDQIHASGEQSHLTEVELKVLAKRQMAVITSTTKEIMPIAITGGESTTPTASDSIELDFITDIEDIIPGGGRRHWREKKGTQ